MAAKTNNMKTKRTAGPHAKAPVTKAAVAGKAKAAAPQPKAKSTGSKAPAKTVAKPAIKPAAAKAKAAPVVHKPAAAKPAHRPVAAHAPVHAHAHTPKAAVHVAPVVKPSVHAAAAPKPVAIAPAVHAMPHQPIKTATPPVMAPRPVLAPGHRPAGGHSPMGHKRPHSFHGQPTQLPRDVIERNPTLKLDPNKKKTLQRHGFRTSEYVVYPSHGVGKIVAIEEQVVAGHALELFVINFEQEKMTLRVPTAKLAAVGMRKLSEDGIVRRAMETLKGRARIKRTMWSRRAQEYENKINSGDLISISEVVRDLYRAETQPEQSYSERQLFEAALDRMSREIAAIEKLDERGAVQKITEVLSKSVRGRAATKAAEDAAASATGEGQAA